jgi:hypothetical protein
MSVKEGRGDALEGNWVLLPKGVEGRKLADLNTSNLGTGSRTS